MNGLRNVTVLEHDLAGGATLDELGLSELSLLYMEDEAIAVQVLAGAEALIWERRPRIFVTIGEGGDTTAIAGELQKLGYRIFAVKTPHVGLSNFNRVEPDTLAAGAAMGLLGLPEELPGIRLPANCEEIALSPAG